MAKKTSRRVLVVMPAYNAASTLARTQGEIPFDYVDEVVVVDDASTDATAAVARELRLPVLIHPRNRGYGGNQKTCYHYALERGAEIVIMLHPDYQYTPKLIPAMVTLLESGLYDLVLGSRILNRGAVAGGMPRYKYVANRVLTLVQNLLIGQKLSEYHTGYRAYTAEALRGIPFDGFSDDFIFDNQFLIAAFERGYRVAEISCPTKYFPEASSINFRRSVVYGLLVVWHSLRAAGRRVTEGAR